MAVLAPAGRCLCLPAALLEPPLHRRWSLTTPVERIRCWASRRSRHRLFTLEQARELAVQIGATASPRTDALLASLVRNMTCRQEIPAVRSLPARAAVRCCPTITPSTLGGSGNQVLPVATDVAPLGLDTFGRPVRLRGDVPLISSVLTGAAVVFQPHAEEEGGGACDERTHGQQDEIPSVLPSGRALTDDRGFGRPRRRTGGVRHRWGAGSPGARIAGRGRAVLCGPRAL